MINNNVKYKKLYILAFLGLFLIAARIGLPYILLHYVIQQINTIPGYHAKIEDLSIRLIQGRYLIKNIELWQSSEKVSEPFLKADTIIFSLQWSALLKGKLVGEIETQHPTLNFITEPDAKNQQLTIDQRWLAVVKSLFPLNINQVTVHQGSIFLQSFRGNPPFSIYLKKIEFQLKNLQNASRLKTGLLSSFHLTAKAMNNTEVELNGKLDPFANVPTFYLTSSIKSLPVTEINSFLKHYVDVKAKSGQFSLFVELAAANGKISGYAKPFLKNFSVDTNEKEGALHQLYTNVVDIGAKILKNRQQKSIATQVNFKGSIDDPDVSIFAVVIYFLHHGFIQALLPKVDQKISMKDVQYPKAK